MINEHFLHLCKVVSRITFSTSLGYTHTICSLMWEKVDPSVIEYANRQIVYILFNYKIFFDGLINLKNNKFNDTRASFFPPTDSNNACRMKRY